MINNLKNKLKLADSKEPILDDLVITENLKIKSQELDLEKTNKHTQILIKLKLALLDKYMTEKN